MQNCIQIHFILKGLVLNGTTAQKGRGKKREKKGRREKEEARTVGE